MAYGIKYKRSFTDSYGNDYVVNILEKDYTSSSRWIPGQDDVLNIKLISQSDPKETVIKATQATFGVYGQVKFEFEDIFTSNPRQFKIEVTKNTEPYWRGYLAPDIYQQTYLTPPNAIEMAGNDGMDILADEDHTFDEDVLVTGVDAITTILDSLDLSLGLKDASFIYPAGSNEAESALHNVQFNTLRWFKDERGERVPFSKLEVLETILATQASFIVQQDGYWNIIPFELSGKQYRTIEYDLTGTKVSTINVNPVVDAVKPNKNDGAWINADQNMSIQSRRPNVFVTSDTGEDKNFIPSGTLETGSFQTVGSNTFPLLWSYDQEVGAPQYTGSAGVEFESEIGPGLNAAWELKVWENELPTHWVWFEGTSETVFNIKEGDRLNLNILARFYNDDESSQTFSRIRIGLKWGEYYLDGATRGSLISSFGAGEWVHESTITPTGASYPRMDIERTVAGGWTQDFYTTPPYPGNTPGGGLQIRIYPDDVAEGTDPGAALWQFGSIEATYKAAEVNRNTEFVTKARRAIEGLKTPVEYELKHGDSPLSDRSGGLFCNGALIDTWSRRGYTVEDSEGLVNVVAKSISSLYQDEFRVVNGSLKSDGTFTDALSDQNVTLYPVGGSFNVKKSTFNGSWAMFFDDNSVSGLTIKSFLDSDDSSNNSTVPRTTGGGTAPTTSGTVYTEGYGISILQDTIAVDTNVVPQLSEPNTFTKDIIIQGDLTVNGTEFISNTQTVEIADNLGIINSGEQGAGITSGFAGWQVDRGTATDFNFGYQESNNAFSVGKVGTTLQAIATRQNSPSSNGVAYWNDSANRFDTSTTFTHNSAGSTFIHDIEIVGNTVKGAGANTLSLDDNVGITGTLNVTGDVFGSNLHHSNWNTAYDRSPTGFSINSTGVLTLSKQVGSFTADLKPWGDERYANTTGDTFTGDVTLSNGKWLRFSDQRGVFPTDKGGFSWNLNNDGAQIYAFQPESDHIDLTFKITDNNNTADRFVFWVDEHRGEAYDRYPLIMTGQHAEFDVDIYAQKELILTNQATNSNHALRADRIVAGGSGLTGGGNLTTNRIIELGTPSTISVGTINGTTTSSHTHHLDLSGRTVTLGNDSDSIITWSNNTQNLDANRTWIPTLKDHGSNQRGVLSPNAQTIYGNKYFAGSAVQISNQIQSPNATSRVTGWQGDNQGNWDFRSIFSDSLVVKSFTADVAQAFRGSRFLTKSFATITNNFTIPAVAASATLTVNDVEGFTGLDVFEMDDYILLTIVNQSDGGLTVGEAWGEITSTITDNGDGTQSFTFTTRNVSTTGIVGMTANEGSEALSFGSSTSPKGFIHDTVLDNVGSPYSQVVTWTTNPWDRSNWKVQTRTGNLAGIGNASGYGFYGQNTYITDTAVIGDLSKTGNYVEYNNGVLTIDGILKVQGSDVALSSDILTSYTQLSNRPNFGDLAFDDKVETATLGTTIISGGLIKTSLLDVSDIIATGNVVVTGDNISNLTNNAGYQNGTQVSSAIDSFGNTLGNLADRDNVDTAQIVDGAIETAKLGTTIITGGYIKTSLLNVTDIIATGNVVVTGDNISSLTNNAGYQNSTQVNAAVDSLGNTLGALATRDNVDTAQIVNGAIETAKLGTTVISGGYIKTTLLNVSDIIASGNVVVTGDNISDLTNNAGYQNSTQVNGAINTFSNSLGNLANLNTVDTAQIVNGAIEEAKLGTTVISGGYIKTSLLNVSDIIATGNVVVTGDNISNLTNNAGYQNGTQVNTKITNFSNTLGDLANKNDVDTADIVNGAIETAKLGTTVITGGYIKTSLLNVSDIIATGNVVVSGDNITDLSNNAGYQNGSQVETRITNFSGTLGNLAFDDKVETATLGTTIISGGVIKTSLLDVTDIFAQNTTVNGTLTLGTGGNFVSDAVNFSKSDFSLVTPTLSATSDKGFKISALPPNENNPWFASNEEYAYSISRMDGTTQIPMGAIYSIDRSQLAGGTDEFVIDASGRAKGDLSLSIHTASDVNMLIGEQLNIQAISDDNTGPSSFGQVGMSTREVRITSPAGGLVKDFLIRTNNSGADIILDADGSVNLNGHNGLKWYGEANPYSFYNGNHWVGFEYGNRAVAEYDIAPRGVTGTDGIVAFNILFPGTNMSAIRVTDTNNVALSHQNTGRLVTTNYGVYINGSLHSADDVQIGGRYKVGSSFGITTTRQWYDVDGYSHYVTVKGGIITSWTTS